MTEFKEKNNPTLRIFKSTANSLAEHCQAAQDDTQTKVYQSITS